MREPSIDDDDKVESRSPQPIHPIQLNTEQVTLLNRNIMSSKKTAKKKNSASEAASAFGRIGGKAVVKKHGKTYMQNLGKKGAEARWSKNKKKK